jgi:hypothetical protein
MTDRAKAKKAHNWLYRGVCVRILNETFGDNIVELIRGLAYDKTESQFYDSKTVEALLINNRDPKPLPF